MQGDTYPSERGKLWGQEHGDRTSLREIIAQNETHFVKNIT
jgi:hypothetical protein